MHSLLRCTIARREALRLVGGINDLWGITAPMLRLSRRLPCLLLHRGNDGKSLLLLRPELGRMTLTGLYRESAEAWGCAFAHGALVGIAV